LREIHPKPDHFIIKQKKLILGVKKRSLFSIADERGRLTELLRSDWPEFIKFGQVYMTAAYPSVVKAWHYHENQIDNFVCVKGMIKLVLYDGRKNSKSFRTINEFFIGDYHSMLIQIPAGIYHGFKCISDGEALVINVPTAKYNSDNPDEFRLPAHTKKIPYDWSRKDG